MKSVRILTHTVAVEENQDRCATFQGSWSGEQGICIFPTLPAESADEAYARYVGYVTSVHVPGEGYTLGHAG